MYRSHRVGFGGLAATGAIRCPHGHSLSSIKEILIRLLDRLAVWQERAEGRQRLLTLDDRLLADIGGDRGRVLAEADKPFWQA